MNGKSMKPEHPGRPQGWGQNSKSPEGIKEKTGATAEEIRKAVEVVGFDRAKVEEYIMTHSHQS